MCENMKHKIQSVASGVGVFLLSVAALGVMSIFYYGLGSPGRVLGETLSITNIDTSGLTLSSTGTGAITPFIDTTPPTRPTGLSAVISGNSITISWSSSSDNVGVVGYALSRNGNVIKTLEDTRYTDSNVTAGMTYKYYVVAGDAAGNKSERSSEVSISIPKVETISTTNTGTSGTTSQLSATTTAVTAATAVATGDTIDPSRPENVSVTIIDQRTVRIQWTASSDNVGVAGYKIFKNGNLLTGVNGTSFSDTSVYGGFEYRYSISARDSAGNESSRSDEKRIFIPLVTVETGTATTNTTWTTSGSADTLIVKNSVGTTEEKSDDVVTLAEPVVLDEVDKKEVVQKTIDEAVRENVIGQTVRIDDLSSEQVVHLSELQQLDFDHDGVSNAEEIRLGTDPYTKDSDHDGFNDGDEIQSGHDPKKFSPGDGRDKIIKEDMKSLVASEKTKQDQSGGAISKNKDIRYAVEKVELIKAQSETEKDKLRFSGKALPNTFITLYVYSTPTIITVKTDADGNWSYDLDKNVDDGEHEVYVAVTDNTGKITARGEGIGFVKTANAVTVKPIAEAAETAVSNQSPLERSQTEYFFVAFIAILFFSGAALIVVSRKSSIG